MPGLSINKKGQAVACPLCINVLPMSDIQHQYDYPLVLDAANNAIVPHPVPPEAGKVRPQRIAEVPGIFAAVDAVAEII